MSAAAPDRAGFLARGGWVVVATLGVATVAFAYYALDLVRHRARPVGDGRHVESYGFALTPCLVPRERLVASGMAKDGLAALIEPAHWTPARADAATTRYAKFLVSGDRVIGLRLGNETRAYPLRILAWHEVVNDTLGGAPVLVTYNPLCDSAVAFRREIAGGKLTFGVSGLLYDSNLLMYDRQPAARDESLWSQLLFAAVAGPAAASGRTLAVLPISIETWREWRGEHPDTTVLAPDPGLVEKYASDPYASYASSDLLRYPVAPLPAPARFALKTPVVAVSGPNGWTAFPFPVVADLARGGRRPAPSAASASAALEYRPGGPTVAVDVTRLSAGAGVVYASYFAWYATHGADTTWAGGGR